MEQGIFYKLYKLEQTQFATFEENYDGKNADVDISCEFIFSYNSEFNIVCCTSKVIFKKYDKVILKTDLNAYFAINKDSIALLIEGNELVFPVNLLCQFASLTYGTMRGVIFSKTQGSQLSLIILPPNNIFDIIKNPLRIKLDK